MEREIPGRGRVNGGGKKTSLSFPFDFNFWRMRATVSNLLDITRYAAINLFANYPFVYAKPNPPILFEAFLCHDFATAPSVFF